MAKSLTAIALVMVVMFTGEAAAKLRPMAPYKRQMEKAPFVRAKR